MTVNTTNITSGPYIGNGASDQYSYTFRVTDKTQLKIFETTDLGARTLLVVDTDYTVAGIGDDAGGIITRIAGNLPTDYEWYIRADYDFTQLSALPSQGPFFPDVHEDAFDKLTFQNQQQEDTLTRTFRLSDEIDIDGDFTIAADAANRSGKYLSFDTAGDLQTSAAPQLLTVDGIYDSVALMKVDSLAAGLLIQTRGYYAAGGSGAATYLIKAPQAFDTYGDHELANNNIAVLQPDVDIKLSQYGVKEDNTDISLPFNAAMVAALAVGKNAVGSSGAAYGIGAQLLLKPGVFVKLSGTTVTRLASYTTVEPAIINSLDNTKDLTVIGGIWNDDTSVTQPLMSFTTVNKLEVCGGRYESITGVAIKARVTNGTNIYANKFKDNINDTSIDVDDHYNTAVTINHFVNVLHCAKMEASLGDSGRSIFSNNIVDSTIDTAVFMRALAGNTRSQMIANDNAFTDIGKACIKFSVPNGNANSVIYGGIANGNTIKGYGINVTSPAISAFRDTSDTTVVIEAFTAIGNVITGLDSSDVISTLAGDCAAISARYVDKVLLNNTVHDVREEGVEVFECSNLGLYGVVKKACQSAGVGGVNLQSVAAGTVDAHVDSSGSSKSGLFLNAARDLDIKGSYTNNGNYGIEESSAGGGGVWTDFNRYSAVLTGNTTGPILYAGGTSSQEMGCIDDSGSRHAGTTTRRGLLALRSNGCVGLQYFDTTVGKTMAWDGAYWIGSRLTATTTELEDIADIVNTSNEKIAGFSLLNTTTNILVAAAGPNDASVWVAAGATAHTPIV